MSHLQHTYDELCEEVKDLQERIGYLQEQLFKRDVSIVKLMNEFSGKRTTITATISNNEDVTDEQNVGEAQVEDLEAQVEDLEAQLRERDVTIKILVSAAKDLWSICVKGQPTATTEKVRIAIATLVQIGYSDEEARAILLT